MLLISTTHRPATDLGFLLHKNPARLHELKLTFGSANLLYPEASEERCTAAVMLRVDPVRLVRGKEGGSGSLAQYVNDRPYVANSFLSVAIAELFGTTMAGRSKERAELAESPIPLELRIPVLSCRSAEERIRRLFEPLGYEVEIRRLTLDDQYPEWGESNYYDVTLKGDLRVRDAIRHLYLLIPVLDARKHYYMDKSEVEKLLVKGEGWLADHPEKEWIVRSFFARKPSLMRSALEQLSNIEEELETEEQTVDDVFVAPEEPESRRTSLHEQRHDRILELVRDIKPQSVVDLGCGDGRLLRRFIPIKGIDKIVGMDVSYFELEKAERKLRLEEAGPRFRSRVELIHGSLMYRDERLHGFDLATIVEVVEHLDPPRLAAFERVVFEFAQPKRVLLTTPNREYNVEYTLGEDLRHLDHRFEWTRAEFETWSSRVAESYGYRVRFEGIGEPHPEWGSPSQMAVFER